MCLLNFQGKLPSLGYIAKGFFQLKLHFLPILNVGLFPNTKQVVVASEENLIPADGRAGGNLLAEVVSGDDIEPGSRTQDCCYPSVRDKIDISLSRYRRGAVAASKAFHPQALAVAPIETTGDTAVGYDE